MQGFDTADLKFYANESVKISGRTKLYGIIGWPVVHSLSPMFQCRFIQQFGLDAVYVPFAVRPKHLPMALEGLWASGVMGVNVTVPHKETTLRMVSADEDARLIGAVNTLRRTDGGWEATNTDWHGFSMTVQAMGMDLTGQTVLVFGAGGTARAVFHALAKVDGINVLVSNRSPQRLHAFIADMQKNYPQVSCREVPWKQEAVSEACKYAVLLVNTTAIGLHSNEAEEFPFELAGDGAAVDVVYQPEGRTVFCMAAKKAGRDVVDGLPMLVAQGAASFAWWHGKKPDVAATYTWLETQLMRAPDLRLNWRLVS